MLKTKQETKTQKKASNGRLLPQRQLKDIKKEVGEDTKALLLAAKTSLGEKPAGMKQISLRDLEEPQEKPTNVEATESEIINVKSIPDRGSLIEVRDFNELRKVGKAFRFINCYEDEKQRVYFVGDYFYRVDKKLR
ncbi:MAG: hypothetical protein JW778_06750 [Candidatus Altiarchaeota archaeon]|nr:hypothetical protein [Candidatus Altiarchaeota archaeon]